MGIGAYQGTVEKTVLVLAPLYLMGRETATGGIARDLGSKVYRGTAVVEVYDGFGFSYQSAGEFLPGKDLTRHM